MLPSLFLSGMHDLMRKFLIQAGCERTVVKIMICATLVHMAICTTFIHVLKFEILGLAMANLFTNFVISSSCVFAYRNKEEFYDVV